MKRMRTSHVNSEVRRGFAPQFGQAFADLLISWWHSWHVTRAIFTSQVDQRNLESVPKIAAMSMARSKKNTIFKAFTRALAGGAGGPSMTGCCRIVRFLCGLKVE